MEKPNSCLARRWQSGAASVVRRVDAHPPVNFEFTNGYDISVSDGAPHAISTPIWWKRASSKAYINLIKLPVTL